MSCARHGRAIVRGLPPYPFTDRCWYCGHRLPVRGVLPRQTREMHVKLWPVEIVSRFRAKVSINPRFLTFDKYERMMYGDNH